MPICWLQQSKVTCMLLKLSYLCCVLLQEKAARRIAELEATGTEKDIQLAEKDGRIAYWEGKAKHADTLLTRIRKSKTNAGLLAKWEQEIFTSQGNLLQTAPSGPSTSWVSCAYFTESPCHIAVQSCQSGTACGNLQM